MNAVSHNKSFLKRCFICNLEIGLLKKMRLKDIAYSRDISRRRSQDGSKTTNSNVVLRHLDANQYRPGNQVLSYVVRKNIGTANEVSGLLKKM